MELFLAFTIGLFTLVGYPSTTSSEEEQVTQCVERFVKGADQQDQSAIASVLHDHFRVMLNPGNDEVQLISKDQYLSLIKEKKIGGTPRTLSIDQIDVYGSKTAKVKAQLSSEKMTFYSYYSLVKVNGNWQIVQDLVHIASN